MVRQWQHLSDHWGRRDLLIFKCQDDSYLNVLCWVRFKLHIKLNIFLLRDILKWASCRPRGPEDVSQEEKEEAWDISAKELWAPCPHLIWCQARLLCRPADTMAKPDREPAQAQTHGGPLQDNRGGAETKEGTPPLLSFNSVSIFWPYLELIVNSQHTIRPGPH